MASGAGIIWLAVMFQQVFSNSSIFRLGKWDDYLYIALLVVVGVALIIAAFRFGFGRHDV
jgi:hypothetical protein